ncbi:hypothetical protein CAEBREN_23377 [Caenorhabditis brenneri]|uniref:Uncharacterized protein n=1 Tax=Caenorhabditis brenneri TaxID=135651 RepID=G0MA66_CAEBE|nr:hypothetical protein CAEBREN_23377 [Caenorhabditis brenneri]
MVVKIVLTEKMIENFNQCDDSKDYRKFYTDNREFFGNFFEKLQFVESPHDLDNKICSNAKFLLRYLWKWDRNSPFLNGDKPTEFEKAFSNLFDFLKTDIMTDKWNILYSEYVFAADSIIKRARKQEVFDFQIEFDKKFYETFKARDKAKHVESKTPPEYPDATEYASSDSEDEVVSSGEDSEDEIEDSEDDDFSSDDSDDDLGQLVKEMSEKLDTVSGRLASLEATNKAPTNDSPIDLKSELAKMSQVFTHEMAELRVVMNDFKTEINNKLEQMESRIKEETLEKKDFFEKIDEKFQVMKSEINLEIGSIVNELDERMNTRNAFLERNIDEKLQMMKSEINIDIGTKLAEFDEKMNTRNEVLEGKLEHLAGIIDRENEIESVASEPELHENREQDNQEDLENDFDPEPEVHKDNDGVNRVRDEDDDEDQENEDDIQIDYEPELHENVALDDDEDIQEMEEAFQKALAEQTRAQEEELRRVQERRREMNGDYHQLFNDYRPFFRSLGVNFRRVIFPGHHLCKILSLELRSLFDFLKNWSQDDPNSQLGYFYWKDQIPEFFQHLKLAISEKNWQSFYENYRPIADLMIREARKQEILDFRIEYGSELFESFESMDEARSLIPDDFSEPNKADFCIDYFLDAEGYLIPPEPLERFSDKTNEETSTSSVSLHFSQAEISDLKQFVKQEIDSAKQDIMVECNQAQLKRIEAKLDTKLTSIMNKVTSSERRLEATLANDSPIDLKAELAEMNQLFTRGMTELRVVISDFKNSDIGEDDDKDIRAIREEFEREFVSDAKSDLENQRNQENEEDIERGFNVKPELHENAVMDDNQEIRALQEDIQEEFERALVSDDESDLENHRDQDLEDEIRIYDDAELYEYVAMDDDEDIREMEAEFQRALAEQTRAQEEELQRVRNRRRELNTSESSRRRKKANKECGESWRWWLVDNLDTSCLFYIDFIMKFDNWNCFCYIKVYIFVLRDQFQDYIDSGNEFEGAAKKNRISKCE